MIPEGAKIVRMRVWGGGDGVFWQLGSAIGVEWARVPDWGEAATSGVRSRSWPVPEVIARRWLALLAEHSAISYHRSER